MEWQRHFSKKRFLEESQHVLSGYRLAERNDINPGAELFYINTDRYGNIGTHKPIRVKLDDDPIRRAEWGRDVIYGVATFDDYPLFDLNPQNHRFVNDLEAFERDDSCSGILLVRK